MPAKSHFVRDDPQKSKQAAPQENDPETKIQQRKGQNPKVPTTIKVVIARGTRNQARRTHAAPQTFAFSNWKTF